MKFYKKENGSITIEAAMIIPLFLMLILLLTSFVKISIAEMALKESVSETAQTVAHYSYLAMVAQNTIKQKSDAFVDSLTEKAGASVGLENNVIANTLLGKIADSGKKLIPTSGNVMNDFSNGVYETVVKQKYKQKVGSSSFFNPEGITVVNSSVPEGTSGESALVKVEAENTLQLIIPFFQKEITIKKKAVERGWVGN
ncbi:hypothetical protein CFK37_12180 [Virgibacillus phasianinus]|uniref:Pilus assembly protein TadE n=1 Tax=Virgibacillus phasianinus TaxID=2017483 RepID=A0A220U4U2_9BACI|nr:TadE/TadG family type IV pilus assembly protein [Virgibacillus phasianinus]ASK62851.1 hypothetical protein CFK37_12180 [Virgibacillus phasianinus]